MVNNAVFTRRACLVLSLVRVELVAGEPGPVPQLLHDVARRFGVSPQVERHALRAWRAEERIAQPARKKDPKRMSILALAQASARLRAAVRRAA